jgi:DNA-directed RNA polymerase specialized sigma24 family protein
VSFDPVPVERLERDWRRELAGPRLALCFDRWRKLEPALAAFGHPAALISYLRRSDPGEREDAVLRALLRRAGEDPLAALVVLQAMLPGLKSRVGRILIDARERDEVWSLVLARAWERIRTYPVERLPRHVAANLVLSASRDALESLAAGRKRACVSAGEPSPELPAPGQEGEDVIALLARAVRAAAISAEEAKLIFDTRVRGWPLDQVAADAGVTRHALVVRRLRAEERLFLHLGYGRVTHRRSKPPLWSARVTGAGASRPAGGGN